MIQAQLLSVLIKPKFLIQTANMLKSKPIINLSNLINDCVVMIQQAGSLVQQANLESSFSRAAADSSNR